MGFFKNIFTSKVPSTTRIDEIDYSKIDKNFKPKIDPNKKIEIPMPRSFSSVSLTKQERQEKGLKYLEKAKELKKNSSSVT